MDAGPDRHQFVCDACGTTVDHGNGPGPGRCAECDGWMRPRDILAASLASEPPSDGESPGRLTRLDPTRIDPLGLGAGATPLVDCPSLGAGLGVDRVSVKDEGQNPTGSVAARGAGIAVHGLAPHVERVRHHATGHDAVAIAAAAARAGIGSTAFVPSRAPFTHKAMVNVHGGEMQVIQGTSADAADACRDATGSGHALSAFSTPYRAIGQATLLAEVMNAGSPDAIVCPVGTGLGFVSLTLAATSLAERGVEPPTVHGVQAAGCDPLVRALDRDASTIEAVEAPDTVVGDLAVAGPDDALLRAGERSEGTAVSVADDDILAASGRIAAGIGVGVGLAGAAAAAGADRLARSGNFAAEDHVVLVNPTAPTPDADVLRSHLMRAG